MDNNQATHRRREESKGMVNQPSQVQQMEVMNPPGADDSDF